MNEHVTRQPDGWSKKQNVNKQLEYETEWISNRITTNKCSYKQLDRRTNPHYPSALVYFKFTNHFLSIWILSHTLLCHPCSSLLCATQLFPFLSMLLSYRIKSFLSLYLILLFFIFSSSSPLLPSPLLSSPSEVWYKIILTLPFPL